MINLDNYSVYELREFLDKAEDKERFALQLFPDRDPGYVRTLNLLVKYAKEKIDVLEHSRKGRIEKAKLHEETCSKIFRLIPDYAKWL